MTAITDTESATDIAYAVAPLYVHTPIVVPAAVFTSTTVDELHLKLSRVASSNDPLSFPGLHHIAVIQQLLH